jgi:1,4-dihydroxy-2-naphthoyl-CoA synthase
MTALDTGTEDLRAEIGGGVAVITMNRPDPRNAFSPAMVSALGAVLAQVETDETVGCVVLTGAGGAFSAATSRTWPPRRPIAEPGSAGRSTPHPPPATEPAGH